MAELIPGVVATPENDSKTVQVPSVKNDHTVNISIDDLYDTSDDALFKRLSFWHPKKS